MRSDVDQGPGAAAGGEAHSARIGVLESKACRQEQAVRSHALIDQAIGVLIAVGRRSAEAAWDVLRETSMSTNAKLRHVRSSSSHAALVRTQADRGPHP